MTAPGIEVIDLTEPASQAQAFSETSGHIRSLRLQKRPRTEITSESNSPIVISDDEEISSLPVPSAVSSDPQKKRRAKRRKKKQTRLEEGQVAEGNDNRNKSSSRNAASPDASGSDNRMPAPEHNSSPPLFYIDDTPDNPPVVNEPVDVPAPAGPANPSHLDSLLLPDHVVLDAAPRNKEVAVVTEKSGEFESDTDDFIHYADAELNLFQRYYEDSKDSGERKAHLVCGQCGAEGDHKQADCPVVVCLTCGAHNEHSTRQCPIVKTCFGCGMKGHVNKDCPNKHSSRRMIDRDIECVRCGSDLHRSRECPTLWRMYEYVDDSEREATLKTRREKENLQIGQGGEGYIGEDYWCYNCGGDGHLGDDCEIEPRHPDSREPSAFGALNTMSGPFADREHVRSGRRRLRREWELNGNFDDGHGFAGPSNVGKRGRDKEQDRMRRREREVQEDEDDEDNWFDTRRQSSSDARSKRIKGKGTNEKLVLRLQNGGEVEKDNRRPGDRLLDRISSGQKGEEDRRRGHDRHRSISPRNRQEAGLNGRPKRDRERDLGRDQRRDRVGERDLEREPSYRRSAGYSYRSSRGDRRREEQRSGRQYYGDYVR